MTAMQQAQDDYRLTTVEIFYHSYDNPEDMQSLTWQDYDLAPDYPELRRFLTYWSRHIDGVVHSVRVAGTEPEANAPKRGSTTRMLSTAIH
jgi:uncharacterized protein Usg